ncbi:MAG: hypothetical protein JWO73_107 [Candidatus Taylorbacteria bacterium]|nr:hypothetical protein [Candidatus Taylorbacteria bacterium]
MKSMFIVGLLVLCLAQAGYVSAQTAGKAQNSAKPQKASLTLAVDAATPPAQLIAVSSGQNGNEADMVTVLIADVLVKNGYVVVPSLTVTFEGTAVAAGHVPVAYLFKKGMMIASAFIIDGAATFSDINQGFLEQAPNPVTVKVDLRNVPDVAETVIAGIESDSLVVLGSLGKPLAKKLVSGEAVGEVQSIVKEK